MQKKQLHLVKPKKASKTFFIIFLFFIFFNKTLKFFWKIFLNYKPHKIFMQINIINSCRYVVAICDTNLLGKNFSEGQIQLDIKESFYKGEEKSEKETIEIIRDMAMEDATFNIIGHESVNAALKAGLILKEDIKKIEEIPFVMVLM